jgi:hypothetical protein
LPRALKWFRTLGGNGPKQYAMRNGCDVPPFSQVWKGLAPGSEATYTFDMSTAWTNERMFQVTVAFDLWNLANQKVGLDTRFSEITEGTPTLLLKNVPRPEGEGGRTIGDPPFGQVAADGTLLRAEILFSNNETTVKHWSMYRKVALHEIGHTLGLGDNVNFIGPDGVRHPDGRLGSSVMNRLSNGRDDPRGNVSIAVTPCDYVQAKKAPTRPWPPQP